MSKGQSKAPDPARGSGMSRPARSPDAATLMRLEADMRAQPGRQDLTFHLVNALPQYFAAPQAIAFKWNGAQPVAIAASNIPKPNPDSIWLQVVTREISGLAKSCRSAPARLSLAAANDEKPANLPFGLFVPLRDTPKNAADMIVLTRERAWQDGEIAIAQYLADAYAHAFQRSEAGPGRWQKNAWRIAGWLTLAAILAAMLFVQVPSLAVAPARVVAASPVAVAPAMAGQVVDVPVRAGDDVRKGDVLIELDDSIARADLESARQALIVADIKEAQLRNMALRQPQARADLLIAEAEVVQARIDIDEAEMLLDLHKLRAPVAGRVVGERLDRLIGRPVNFGDVLLTLSDPDDVQVTADVAVTDSAFIYGLQNARFFPNDTPFSPAHLTTQRIPAAPELDARGTVSYPLHLTFSAGSQPFAIGAEGIVQLSGPRAPLGYVILRKPITWVIQRLPPDWYRWMWQRNSDG